MDKLPHEIRRQDGSPAYHCRTCLTTEDLRWFNGTSCPVCRKPECSKELWGEWDAALNQPEEEPL